eukprot:5591635-Karenia_brevis.AAC.1
MKTVRWQSSASGWQTQKFQRHAHQRQQQEFMMVCLLRLTTSQSLLMQPGLLNEDNPDDIHHYLLPSKS